MPLVAWREARLAPSPDTVAMVLAASGIGVEYASVAGMDTPDVLGLLAWVERRNREAANGNPR